MRNILIFPDNKELSLESVEIDFMYPPNKTLKIGTQFYVDLDDGSKVVVEIAEIKKEQNKILYYLKYVSL